MPTRFFSEIYESWKPKQLEKYQALLPEFKKLIHKDSKILDVGIGFGWLWEFLKQNGVKFGEIIGLEDSTIQTDEQKLKVIGNELPYVRYFFDAKELIQYCKREKISFDLMVFFDSFHLIDLNEFVQLQKLLHSKSNVLIALPLSFVDYLHGIELGTIEWEKKIGKMEKDYCCLMKA